MDIVKYTDMAILYASQYGMKIVAAILIFIIGKWAIGKLTILSKKALLKAGVDKTLVEFAETSTVDLGDTSDVTLDVVISGANMVLRATTTSSTWTIKTLIRVI